MPRKRQSPSPRPVEEQRRLSNLEAIANKLGHSEIVQNRQLPVWLSEDGYSEIDTAWQVIFIV